MKHITNPELRLIWKHTHPDFKGIMNGVRTILTLRQGGTTLVRLDDLTDEEKADKLKYAKSREARGERGY